MRTQSAGMTAIELQGVQVLHWNPRRPIGLRPRRFFKWTKQLPFAPRVDNFGDLLGPRVVAQFAPDHASEKRGPLAAVGSIIHMLPDDTVVWGPGVNGKHLDLPLPVSLDIRAVRGPLTGKYLAERGYADPGIYGDPALLLQHRPASDTRRDGALLIANLNDSPERIPNVRVVSPLEPLEVILAAIQSSELVIGSSLHAIIMAETLGTPARAIASAHEPTFKYEDYYEGTGRAGVKIATGAAQALELGGEDRSPQIDPQLVASFPRDLWS